MLLTMCRVRLGEKNAARQYRPMNCYEQKASRYCMAAVKLAKASN